MAQKPKLTVAGYRGIWGQDLDEEIAFSFALAFIQMIRARGGTKILVGRDARKTGPQILGAIAAACKSANIAYEYAGILPTPSMMLLTKKLGFDGGIIITASHNPPEYNGLKFILGTGLFADQQEVDEMEKRRQELAITYPGSSPLSPETDNAEFRKIHLQEILKNVDVELIRSKKFKVAHDPINSAGAIITRELFTELGCEVFQINGEQTGDFTHMPEPLAINLGQLAEAVKNSGAAVGFAQDPDADRLVIANERGEILNEEYTLALAVKNIAGRQKTDVVINMSTSRMNEDIVAEGGGQAYRTKVGEANVVAKMLEVGAQIGGEGGGGVICPAMTCSRDSLAGIALTLELIAKEDKPLSKIIESLPEYFMQKDKFTFEGDIPALYARLKERFKDARLDTLDGVRFDFTDDSWIHIRSSNTEPILRIIGEANALKRIEELFATVRLTLKGE